SPSPGSGMSPVAVSASVGSITANTTYDFRIVATNAGGETKGENESFKTLEEAHLAPAVETKPASAITATSATLNAMVNPNGSEGTECKLERKSAVEGKKCGAWWHRQRAEL